MRDGGPAFPLPPTAAGRMPDECGATLRDYFASRVLDRIIAQTGNWSGDDDTNRLDQARLAYQYADAMLKARGASAPANEDITPTLEAHPVNF